MQITPWGPRKWREGQSWLLTPQPLMVSWVPGCLGTLLRLAPMSPRLAPPAQACELEAFSGLIQDQCHRVRTVSSGQCRLGVPSCPQQVAQGQTWGRRQLWVSLGKRRSRKGPPQDAAETSG